MRYGVVTCILVLIYYHMTPYGFPNSGSPCLSRASAAAHARDLGGVAPLMFLTITFSTLYAKILKVIYQTLRKLLLVITTSSRSPASTTLLIIRRDLVVLVGTIPQILRFTGMLKLHFGIPS
ncbi:hypothetical protein K469DRAFT_765304 [Zopfia rhizophila CBS 207.26]|uniref:Uncharacterized protein n=1 Tax=Zopfia rhizophila CBS 207.26 TaxID=1314779 RepID=A0A6A6D796_9PEZI|nr:hypothetical protein K469DRAFT_765304 [Zopfia rhizophila CBS 207.26]